MFGTFMLPSLADIVPSPYLPVSSTRPRGELEPESV